MIAAPRAHFTVPLPGRAPLVLGPRTLVMGVINVTPDSFSDGGKAQDPTRALDIALAMEAAGADIIDIGAESTRPGAAAVGTIDEIVRVQPVVHAVCGRVRIPVSIDTYKADVAAVALDEGAAIVNDISAFEYDDALGPLVASRQVPAILMHTRGRPSDMYAHAEYADVIGDIAADLQRSVDRALAFGISRDRLMIDPGLGFAKRAGQSLEALARMDRLSSLGLPIVAGPSRKSFITSTTGPLDPEGRDWPTAGAVTACVLAGAHVVRVHRVEQMVHVVKLADAIRDAAERP